MSKALTLLAAAGLTGAVWLATGCQEDHGRVDSRPSAASGGSYNNGSAAGIPDSPNGGSTGAPQNGTGTQRYGTEGHSGTLGGGTASDPNINTPGRGN